MPDVWPFRPLLGSSETLEWLTNMLPGYTGEQRIALRQAPRQAFDYAFRLTPAQYSIAKAFARRNGALPVYIPVWAEEIIIGAVSSGATTLSFDTTVGDFRDLVLVWQDPETYAVCEIDTIGPTDVGLTEPVGVDFTHASVFPLRTAITPQGYNANRNNIQTDVSAGFLVTDNVDRADEWATDYPQYQSLDVVTERPVLMADVAESIVRSVEMIDNGFGPVVIEPLKAYADLGQTISFAENRRAGLWRRRIWLHSLRGKQKPFWLPSFNTDLQVEGSVGSGATNINIATIGPAATLVGKHVMLLLTDGTRVMRAINAASVVDPDTDQITISSAFGVAFDPEDVEMFCFLAKVRLNADSVTIEHRLEQQAIVSIPVTEVPA